MRAVTSRAGSLAVGLSLLVLVAFSGNAIAAKSTKTVNATTQLNSLIRKTAAVSNKSVNGRASLLAAARKARKTARQKPCTAVRSLSSYRKTLRKAKPRRSVKGKRARAKLNVRLAALGTQSTEVTRKLLGDKRTKRCGGGVLASTLAAPKTTIVRSDVNGMQLHVRLPGLHFGAQTGGGRSWTQISLPNMESTGTAPGSPGIPNVSSSFAVPDGATVTVKPGSTESYTLDSVDLYPAQPEPVDAATGAPNFDKPPFTARPFTINRGAYAKDSMFPAQPASGGILGTSRDIVLGDLQIPAAQYDPAAHKLKVLNSVDVTVTFNGGPKTFNPEIGSPWEAPERRMIGSLINAKLIPFPVKVHPWRCGEEMLVITNPATLAAANQLATARNAAGLLTSVVETGSGAGQIGATATAIQGFIRAQLSSLLCIHPSYITIVGDDQLVPTFKGFNEIPSDLPYSMKNDSDELPDVAVGRIIANEAAQATAAVTKIVGYETTPPTGDFLTHATIAAFFQDIDGEGQVLDGQENRTFIEFAETVRNGLVARGDRVDRVYTADSAETKPEKFNNGTPLPAELRKPKFAWNGTGAEITKDWNEGRFLIVHRDHGYPEGWGSPGYSYADVEGLTNGAKLPVVLSINCASGAYDLTEHSFAQTALDKTEGGAVGVFGDTRNSPSYRNSQIALGFVDALLPKILPEEGPATKQRVGDALVWGKLRIAAQAPPATNGDTHEELYLWHYYGDPSMQLWGGERDLKIFNVGLFKAVFASVLGEPDPEPGPNYGVKVALPAELAGQTISLLKAGQVVGKAIIGDGGVTIPASLGDGSVRPGELQVAIEPDGSPPVTIPVEGVPPVETPPTETPPVKTPPVEPVATTLAQSCPESSVAEQPLTVTGTLKGAPAGSIVKVTFQRETLRLPPPAQVREAKTDAEGGWSAAVTPTGNEFGYWEVTSAYAGDSTHLGSKTGRCQVSVIE